jgi:transcription initiation protein SPT3
MTREEYQHYSDCRQASFTYRKGAWIIFLYTDTNSHLPLIAKRFREFLNLPPHLDLKANDDTVDIVGFLAFEMVRSLTLAGLTVKKALEESYLLELTGGGSATTKRKAPITPLLDSSAKRRRADDEDDGDDAPLPVSSLFLAPPEARTSLRPEHIQDAFSRMQGDWSHHRSAGMTNWRGGLVRTRVSLI